jgi:glyoxylate reductase
MGPADARRSSIVAAADRSGACSHRAGRRIEAASPPQVSLAHRRSHRDASAAVVVPSRAIVGRAGDVCSPPVAETTIVVTRPVPEQALELLRPRAKVVVGPAEPPIPTAADVVPLVRDADIIYALPASPVTAEAIRGAAKLRMIATMGTGYDNIDVAAARERKVPVTFAPGILDETTADGLFALLLAAARRLPESERFLRAGRYRGWTPFLFLGVDVHEATLGIVGLGRIGKAIARRAAGFRMKILYSDAARNEAAEKELGATFVSLDELLARSDFVSLHVPLLAETRHLIDAKRLRQMKKTAILINGSRGPVVDEHALAEALRDRVIAGAGLDVFEREPQVDPLLLEQENAVLLPHIASASERTRVRMAVRAAENILAFMDNKPLLDPVP